MMSFQNTAGDGVRDMGLPDRHDNGMILEVGGCDQTLKRSEVAALFRIAVQKIGLSKSALIVPPDFSRLQSRAGDLTRAAYEVLGAGVSAVLPALGTHDPMKGVELDEMLPGIPKELIQIHRWRDDVQQLGEIPASVVAAVTEGTFNGPFPIAVSRKVLNPSYDLILSIGQVVPHEVTGMANGVKNLLVGCGGKATIDLSHYIGALYGMERIMGRVNTPSRILLEEGFRKFLGHLPVVFALTVVSPAKPGEEADSDGLVTRGLFVGRGYECFRRAAELSQLVNIIEVPEPIDHAIVYLNPKKYHSTWIGNKAIYRLRMAMALGGEITILAPGIVKFGEDAAIDVLIREHGYRSSKEIQTRVQGNPLLADNLAAAAHLIHGAPDGLRVRYCTHLDPQLIKNVGFDAGDYGEYSSHYDPHTLKQGFNTLHGERIFFVGDPGLGLWTATGKIKK